MWDTEASQDTGGVQADYSSDSDNCWSYDEDNAISDTESQH